MRTRRAVALAGCALLALGAAGCADQQRATAARGADDLGLEAVAVYGRHSAVRGKLDVRLTNTGASAVEVDALQLRSPLYASVPATQRTTTLPADGRERIVPVDFGEVRCDVEGSVTQDVVLTVRGSDGAVDVVVPLADGEPGLARAHRLACGSAAVADAASLELGPLLERVQTPDGPRLRTVLRADRGGDGEVAVTQLLGNVLFDVTVAAPVLVLDADRAQASGEVLVAATRCDAHALTESKTSFTFPVFARLDGGEEVATSVTATGAARDALQALLDDTCGAR